MLDVSGLNHSSRFFVGQPLITSGLVSLFRPFPNMLLNPPTLITLFQNKDLKRLIMSRQHISSKYTSSHPYPHDPVRSLSFAICRVGYA